MIKLLLVVISSSAVILSCAAQHKVTGRIELYNASKYNLDQESVTIQRSKLRSSAGARFPLLLKGRDTVASQLNDIDGDGEWDQLLFQTSLTTRESQEIQLNWVSNAPVFNKQTSIRFGVRQTRESKIAPALSDTFYADQLPGVIGYQHYQTDGPTWENDKVGFRIYLDGRNSIDVFGKRQAAISPENVGIGADGVTEVNYSEMRDWGMDILAVGNSVGIGGISMMIGERLIRLGVTEQDALNNVDTTICRIVSEGPVYSSLQFRYINWKALERRYNIETVVSITPGIHGFKNSVRTSSLNGDETLLVGLVNSKTDHKLAEINSGAWTILYTHDKQTLNKDSALGLALIVPKKDYQGYFDAPSAGRLSTTYLAKLAIKNNKPVEYYAIAAWEGRDARFRDEQFFRAYLLDLTRQLSARIEVKIK